MCNVYIEDLKQVTITYDFYETSFCKFQSDLLLYRFMTSISSNNYVYKTIKYMTFVDT